MQAGSRAWPTRAAFGRNSTSNEDALALLVRAIERAGFRAAEQVAIALDVAASQFGRDGRYRLARERASSTRTA